MLSINDFLILIKLQLGYNGYIRELCPQLLGGFKMKVKCKVCGAYFEEEDVYCSFCSAKYGAEKSQYDDMDLFESEKFKLEKEDRAAAKSEKNEEKRNRNSSLKDIPKERIPDLDTTRELKKMQKKPKNIFRSVILLIVFMNIISGFIRDAEFDDIVDMFDNSSNEEITVPVTVDDAVAVQEAFPLNDAFNFEGDTTAVTTRANGIYQGLLSTATYLNYESKELRFPISDDDYKGTYELPIYITISRADDAGAYFFDVWDQNTLKMLASYEVPNTSFTADNFEFQGEPIADFLDDPETVDLLGKIDEQNLHGRMALPYTITNDIFYFEFDVEKINDDPAMLLTKSYIKNEYYEGFLSDDGNISLDIYTYEQAQGYPHSSMYYDGVFVLSDGDNTYPPMPFYIEDDQFFAEFDYLDTAVLALRETGFNDYIYYDELDTQLYKYHPISIPDTRYTFCISAEIISNGDETLLKGDYEIYNRNDGYEDEIHDFSLSFVE